MKPKLGIATVLIDEANEQYEDADNKQRLTFFKKILNEVKSETKGSGILLFPAGYFHTSHCKPSTGYLQSPECQQFIRPIKEALNEIKNRRIVVVFGVDGRNTSKTSKGFKDQIALAINRSGVIAAARKFHPAPGEEEYVKLAKNYLEEEEGESRIFGLNGKSFYLAVCYDLVGINQKKLPNPKAEPVNAILNCIHRFERSSTPGGGSTHWAKSMAGASIIWKCPVYGSVVFYGGAFPVKWPSGVSVNSSWEKNIPAWKYTDNSKYKDNLIKKANLSNMKLSKGSTQISVRIFK